MIFQENVSFDHYFATYPYAANTDGTPFTAKPGTPIVNGLFPGGLLDHNPNTWNVPGPTAQPFRLGPAQAATCDQGHGYLQEQQSYSAGLMNRFPDTVGVGGPPCLDYGKGKALVMGYDDGNTVTALWNYAQHFAMSDNSYSTTFGPSTPGAVNLIAGQTHGAKLAVDKYATQAIPRATSPLSMPSAWAVSLAIHGRHPRWTTARFPIDQPDPTKARTYITMTGPNVGDLLNRHHITLGMVPGRVPARPGFDSVPAFEYTGSRRPDHLWQHPCGSPRDGNSYDYIPHHEPFQY